MNRTDTTHNRTSPARLALLAASFVFGACTAAEAGTTTSELQTVKVSYRDLDLTTEQGNTTLYRRIAHAAHAACPIEDLRDLGAFAAARACERHALAQAVSQVHSERLAALYAASRTHG